jgi:NhaP-type Na+/H+ or K+/H+ antiporter
MVRNLYTIGALINWMIAGPTAHYALGMNWQMDFLFGAIVTVTSPTVIVPALRTLRPSTTLADIFVIGEDWGNTPPTCL